MVGGPIMDMKLVETSANVLGINSSDFNEIVVFSSYQELLKSKKTKKKKDEITESKNNLLLYLIERQMETTKNFDLKIPFANICKTCRGKGFHITFEVESLSLPCKTCDGTGIMTRPCTMCDGQGKYFIHKISPNGSDFQYEKTCRICKGTGRYLFKKNSKRSEDVKCKQCLGKGVASKLVTTNKIKNTPPCEDCKGTGQFRESIENPVLSLKKGVELQKAIPSKT